MTRVQGRAGGSDIESDKAYAANFTHGFFGDNSPPR
jgi:hypothetical protein